ncbi:MAG: pilin, partial [Candidatus Nomurabacteria bacterium]|nr:pilin [Candidatus Nomurabacteria bacterium]
MKKNTKKEILKLTSFGMKKIFSSILISFILLLNISIPISVFAATPDLLNVSNYTGPENGEVTLIDPMDFSVVFGAPKIPKEVDPPNKNYNVFFQAICLYSNNVTFKMPIGGEESGAHYIISNQSKFEAGKSGGITKIWTWKFSANNMASACPTSEGAPIGVNWTLKEVDSTGNILKEYLNKSFTFKTVKSYNLPGFYYVTIDKNGDYTVSTRFTDETLCGVSSKSFIENNPMFKILEPCKYYNDLPIYNKTNNPVLVTPVNVATNNSIYTMLAPIGGIERMDSSGTDPTCANDPKCITNDIGKYLNIIFKLAIGICAALAVIMLIINGVKYMGDESVFGKTEAKKNMFGAIVGLLIALGAWALLNTINPALTGQNGLSISQASVVLDPEVHGDSPQTAQNGTFCAGKYKTGDAWPSDAT